MTRLVLTGGLLAGLLAGLMAAALHLLFVVPLILEAELYENAVRVPPAIGGSGSRADLSGLGAGTLRQAGTLATDLVAWTGLALLLVVGFALASRAGRRIDARRGAVWGLAGFASMTLAPAMGLAPELPGAVSADLEARQVWWVATVALTAGGLALLSFGRAPLILVAGAMAIALPHVVGAPVPDPSSGTAPPGLSAQFVARVLGVSAVVWVVLGTVAGWLWSRPAR